MTQILEARAGHTTPEMEFVAKREGLEAETIREEVAAGRLVIPANKVHLAGRLEPMGIGIAAKCKINANIGNSAVTSDVDEELRKLHQAVHFGADTVMDLSTGKDIDSIRTAIINASPVPIGTVPIYQMLEELGGEIEEMRIKHFLDMVEHQAKQGVDYMTIHCGVKLEHLHLAMNRVTGIVSRGGSLIAKWMMAHRKQNPLYDHFGDLCDIMREYDVTWSLGDGLRPGSIADASDDAQFTELDVLGELTQIGWERGTQVMVEGPGHIPTGPDPDEHRATDRGLQRGTVLCARTACDGYRTGLRPHDQHDWRGQRWHGMARQCCATSRPKSISGLPNEDDVKQGVIAYKIAAHAADVARHRVGAQDAR